MRHGSGRKRFARWIVAAVAVLLAVVCCTPAGAGPPRTIRLAAIGDSITSFTDRIGTPTGWSWVRSAATGRVVDAGGFRYWGDDTQQLLAGTRPVDADVIVVMAGTNDIGDGSHPVPTARTLQNITAIFAKARVRTKVLSAVAPKNAAPAQTQALNARLRDLAARSGWSFVDPWRSVRATDGRWVAGATGDGIHPTFWSGAAAGMVIRRTILAVAPSSAQQVTSCRSRSTFGTCSSW